MTNYFKIHATIILLATTWYHLYAQTNTNLGTNAGNSGSSNTSIGYYAGDVVTSSNNSFFGAQAGSINTIGANNTFIGYRSGYNNITGGQNTFVGQGSGQSNNSDNNTFIGTSTGLISTTGSYNTFVGQSSGRYNTTGSHNVGLGAWSAQQQTGLSNISIGDYSAFSNKVGNNNVSIGHESGYNVLGSGNILIGYQAGYSETGSDKLYIDNSSTTTPLIYGDFATNKVGINALPGTYTLNVGGTLNATNLFVNGQPFTSAGVWTAAPGGIIYTTTANVGMGTTLANNPNGYKLAVNGKIGAKEVQIENSSITWSDFVFKAEYRLRPLAEVETFIKQYGHLPEIPNEQQVKEEGIKLGEMNAKLLQKIEELTLYVIELRKEVDELKNTK